MADNTCVCCGTVIPEGRMVCPTCEARAGKPKYDPDEFFGRKGRTNADRIRAMSDEELAVNFNDNFLCPPGYATADGTLLTDKCAYHNDSDDEPCRRCWLDWLRQEVDDGNSD